MNRGKYVPAGSSQAHLVFGDIFRFLVTSQESNGSYSTMQVSVPPGNGPGPHLHEDAEEQFFVIEGQLTFIVGDETFEMSTGDFIHIPRGVPHSFTNGPAPAKLLATFGPGHAGDLFEQVGEPISEESVLQRLGIQPVSSD